MPSSKKSRRGGRRPGAGAPKGNLNALKHGRYSRQFAEIAAVFAASPSLREALVNAAERHSKRQTDADQLAWNLLQNTLARATRIARRRRDKDTPVLPAHPEPVEGRVANDGLSIVSPALNQDTNKENAPSRPARQHETTPKREKHLRDNQTPNTNPPEQSPARYETTRD